ncbi:hypothetical protein TCDM_12290 [Trypanosoma cruzi Dm28c]|uniref:Uncharacterized protein n=1 Tax=Trypanosoma cruzi Dm28c TaxID=1416333 RepID=V5AEU8_TRYCR|nr:hypothetical protein TCDM_12290 [Trypanosoma cruzi Dm28c]
MRTENTATVTAGEGHRAAASARNASQRPSLPKTFLQSTVQILICVWVCDGEAEKRSTGRQISTAGWQRYMRYMRCGLSLNNHARWQHTQILKKEKHGGRVWLCVWRCGCLPALTAKKQNKRERNVCSAPQALVARPHVTAPSARRSSWPSSCVQQARRTGPSS